MLDFLVTFGVMSLVMSTVIILLLALQKPIKKRFTPLSRYIIWAVIIIRLCIPVGLGIMPELFTVSVTEQPEPVIITEDYQDRVLAELVVEGKTDYVPPSVEAYIEEHPEIIEESNSFELTKESMLTATLILWLTGAVVFVTVTLIRYFISIAKLNRGLGAPTPELESIYDSVCAEMLLKRKPKLYVSQNATSPMLCGFVRTKVLLPDIDIGEESLRYILCHELTHYKRGDLYIKLAAMLANTLQWFNPLVYIACGKMSEEAELSCDAAVLTKTDLTGRLDYGNSMLEIVKHCKTAPGLTTGFNPKKKAVKERFENIIDTSKRKKAVAILIAVLVVALVCTSIIGCTTKHKSGVVQGLDDVTVEQQKTADPTEEIDQEQRYKEGKYNVYVDQWRGHSEDWSLYYDFDAETLVLEHSDGRRFAYGNEAQDVFGISPTYKHIAPLYARGYMMNGTEGVIFYETEEKGSTFPRINAIVIDPTNGEILASLSYNMDDILSVHSLTRDAFKHYEMAIKLAGDGVHIGASFHTIYNDSCETIPLYTTIDTSFGDVICVTEFNRQSGTLYEITAGENTLDYSKYCDDISKVDRLTNSNGEKAETEDIELLEAFLKGDTATLEAKAGYQKGLLDIYSTLEFGEYLLEVTDYGTVLYVDVKKSGIDGISPGVHKFGCGIMRNLDGQRYIYHNCGHYYNYSIDHPASDWMNWSGNIMLPDKDNYTDTELWGMVCVVRYSCIPESVEKYEEYIKMIFDVSVDLSSYTMEQLDDKIENWGYKDRPDYSYEIIEAYEDSYVTLQFYADYGKTIPVYKVRYDFHETKTESYSRPHDVYVFDGPSFKYDDTGKDAICW